MTDKDTEYRELWAELRGFGLPTGSAYIGLCERAAAAIESQQAEIASLRAERDALLAERDRLMESVVQLEGALSQPRLAGEHEVVVSVGQETVFAKLSDLRAGIERARKDADRLRAAATQLLETAYAIGDPLVSPDDAKLFLRPVVEELKAAIAAHEHAQDYVSKHSECESRYDALRAENAELRAEFEKEREIVATLRQATRNQSDAAEGTMVANPPATPAKGT